jgi:hypothetical protein
MIEDITPAALERLKLHDQQRQQLSLEPADYDDAADHNASTSERAYTR